LTGIAAIGGGTATIGRGSPMVQLGGTGGQGKQGGHTNKSLFHEIPSSKETQGKKKEPLVFGAL